MSKISTETKIPAIRFKGFSREWEKKYLGKVVNLQNGFAFKSQYFTDELTDVIVLTPGSVNIGGGFQNGKGRFYKTEADFQDKYIFNSGDMFITMTDLTPTAQALGFPAIVPDDGNTYLHNQRLGKLTEFEGDKSFLFQLLSTEKIHNKVVSTSSGTTVKHTSLDKFLSCESYFPLKDEQTKIGNYFQQLDTLIAQHQQKHDKLLNIKKALLEKMFPQQGKTLPAIRFKGFSDEWEERELLNNFEKIIDFRGRTPKKLGLEWSDSGYLALSALNVKNGYIDLNIEANYGDQALYDKWMAGNELHKNQVLFTTEAPMGNVAQIPDNNKYILSQRTIAFEVKLDLIEENFLAVMLSTTSMFKKLSSLSSGGTAKGVSQRSLSDVEVLISKDTKEQTKIGKLFQQLDTLINQHQTQLTKLHNIKQACLEKMFV